MKYRNRLNLMKKRKREGKKCLKKATRQRRREKGGFGRSREHKRTSTGPS